MASSRQLVQEGLDHLTVRLDPLIAARLSKDLGPHPWTVVLSELDRAKGYLAKIYDTRDLQAQLRMLTERLGGLGHPFDDHLRNVSVLGGELRIVRNRWAHNDDFSMLDAWRANDFVVRLLAHFGDEPGRIGAEQVRDRAFNLVVAEKGMNPAQIVVAAEDGTEEIVALTDRSEVDTQPDPIVLERVDPTTPTIGSGRAEFEAWKVVLVGDKTVLDELPKKVAKEQVRALASEIVSVEGPIHLDRLARLIGLSFGVRRLHSTRAQQIFRQVKASGLQVDSDKFVWPDQISREDWREFRPNGGDVNRSFLEISPVEIGNAAAFLTKGNTGFTDEEIGTATLRTFGRQRRTKQFVQHLARGLKLVRDRGDAAGKFDA